MTGKIIATKEDKDSVARRLSAMEDDLLAFLQELIDGGADIRWASIARTQYQQGTMAAKRAVYDGLRVTDDAA